MPAGCAVMMLTEAFQNIAGCLLIQAALNPDDSLKTWGTIVAILVGGVGLVTTLVTKTYPWARAKIESRKVAHSLGASLITPGNIERTIRYYVPPYTQSLDPAGGEESRLIHSVKSPLFKTLDDVLSPEGDDRYHILLADSGMGKTSALINYYVRHQRRWRKKKFHIAIVPLGIPDADERIGAIQDRSNTVLFLDALDEDTLAMVDHVERLRLLLKATSDFQRVIITCRTQFFARDEEIPQGTGILKFGSRGGNESAEQVFYKIYLTPFTDEQIRKYLTKRYPIWRWQRRQRAFELVKKIPHLTARPMLLSRIDDLVDADQNAKYSFQLYEEMVSGWIKREKGFVNESDQLRNFSERLAANLYLNRGMRGAERVTRDEIESLAKEWDISIFPGNLSGRGLLNRDAEGNYKFAHRSIMEYLFVKHAITSKQNCFKVEWTDLMKRFLWEMVEHGVTHSHKLPPFVRKMSLMPRRSKTVAGLLTDVALSQGGKKLDFSRHSNPQVQTFIALCSFILSKNVLAACSIHIHIGNRKEVKFLEQKASAMMIPTSTLSYIGKILIDKKQRIPLDFLRLPGMIDFKGNVMLAVEDGYTFITESNTVAPEHQPDNFKGALMYFPYLSDDPNFLIVIEVTARTPREIFSTSELQWLVHTFSMARGLYE
jgi:hypothetical protein